jgi:phenylalanyl-tRNA synthetase beta chain
MMRNPTESRLCELRLSHLSRWLGVEIESGVLRQTLSGLGFKVLHQDGDFLFLESLSASLFREIDLVEAIAHVIGLAEIRAQLPTSGFSVGRRDRLEEFKDRVRKILVSLGHNEACNTILLDPKEIEFWPPEQLIRVRERETVGETMVLQPSLLIGLLRNLQYNESQQIESVRLFELGKTFYYENSNMREVLSLGILLAGRGTQPLEGSEQFYSFQDMKGLAETLLLELGLRNFAFETVTRVVSLFHPSQTLSIKAKDESLGSLGVPSDAIRERSRLRTQRILMMELDLERIFTRLLTLSTPIWSELKPKIAPAYPLVRRTLSVSVGTRVTEGAVRWVLEGEKRLETIFLSQANSTADRKHLKYEITLRDWNKSLSEDEVSEMLERLKNRLMQELGAVVEFT